MKRFEIWSLLFVLAFCSKSIASEHIIYGVNFPGAATAHKELPGTSGTNYRWPKASEMDRYTQFGFNTFRVAILWERAQPSTFSALNEVYMEQLDHLIKKSTSTDTKLVVNLHNFGLRYGKKIQLNSPEHYGLIDFWKKIAVRYKENSNVIFGIMNEPYQHNANEWAEIIQSVVIAIREENSTNTVLISGVAWSGGHSWHKKVGTNSNSEALGNLFDPLDNYLFEIHQYFDENSSGTGTECVSGDIGVERLTQVTEWLLKHKKRAVLGEFGATSDKTCLDAIRNVLVFLASNNRAWAGWIYWVADPWLHSSGFDISSLDGLIAPQSTVLKSQMNR